MINSETNRANHEDTARFGRNTKTMKRALRQKRAAAKELVLEINVDPHGSFLVECLAEHFVNQAAISQRFHNAIREAVEAAQTGNEKPAVVRIHLTFDEVVDLA